MPGSPPRCGSSAWFFDPALAERLMRTVVADALAAAAMAGTAAIAWRIAGREAALIALLLARGRVAGIPSVPARAASIITMCRSRSSVLAVAATVWSDRVRWAAVRGGRRDGLALAIGLECLPYLMVCAAAFALRYVVDRERRAGGRRLWPRARRIVGRRIPRRSSSPATGCAAYATPSRSTGWRWRVDRRARTRGSAERNSRATRMPCALAWATAAAVAAIGAVRLDRAALPARALRHDGPGGVADLARACARDAAAHSADGEEPADRDRDRDLPGGGAGCRARAAARIAICAAISAISPRRAALIAAVVTTLAAIKALFLRDLARHAAGRGVCAASVRGAAAAAARAALRRRPAADARRALDRRDQHRQRGGPR